MEVYNICKTSSNSPTKQLQQVMFISATAGAFQKINTYNNCKGERFDIGYFEHRFIEILL